MNYRSTSLTSSFPPLPSMPQPSSRAKDIRRAAAAVASLGTMGYFGIGVCIGVAAFIVYRYCHPQASAQAASLDPAPPPPGQDHGDDEDDDPGPSNRNSVSANSNVPSNQEGVRSPENSISQWRNKVERKRTSSQLRHRATFTNSRSADQSQPTNPNAGPPSTPSTSTSFDSSTSTTATPSRPLSPTPQVSPMLSGNVGSMLTNPWVDVVQLPSSPRSTSSSCGTTYTRRNRAATVTRYLDQYPESSSIPSVSTPTSQTSNSTQHTIRSTPQPDSQHLPAPPTRSPGDLIYEELLSDEGRSTLPLRSEMEIEWSSILSSGFPNFELPDLRFGGGGNTPDEPREQRQ